MGRILILSLALFAAGVQAQPPGRGGPPAWRFVDAEIGRPGAVVKNAPFSAVVITETSMVLQDGNHIRQTSTLHLYRDSEGRTRREQSLANLGGGTGNSVVFINDPVAGVNYALDPSSKTATRMANGRGPQGPRGGRMRGGPGRGAPPQNVVREALGSKNIEGVVAEGARTTSTIPVGQVGNEQPLHTVVETWYSADLHAVVYSKRSDPRNGETVTRYTNISRTEPLHSLFELPGDYKASDPAGHSAAKTAPK